MYVICHYAEIGLKGKNRKFFEEKLIENLKKSLVGLSCRRVQRISGRILIELNEKAKENKIKEALKNVFGVAYFSFAVSCEQEMEAIKKKSAEFLKSKKFKTFRIETKRSEKDFPLTSQQVNEKVGEYILENLKVQDAKLKVDLTNPDITCFIEIVEKYVFLYSEKIKGQGGLPIGVSGKIISLLSSGIDSPVASFYGMRRGIRMVFLHFHTQDTEKIQSIQKQNSIEKTKKIIKTLNKYQFSSKLYLVPFLNIQKGIFQETNPELGCILCRRFMFRIAEVLAEKEKAEALITGENIGQVASQTLVNIRVTEEAVNLPVLRPLIGMDKKDIIDKAKEIGTFDTSILAEEFYCHEFLAKHPETKANLEKVKEEEKKLNIEKLIKEAVKKAKVEII
jgi:thiamine biosynthesis protein ThiI